MYVDLINLRMQFLKKIIISYLYGVLCLVVTTAHAYNIHTDIIFTSHIHNQTVLDDIKKELEFKEKPSSLEELHEQLKAEELRLKQYLNAYGYYSAQIDYKIISIVEKKVDVRFFINAREPFRISKIYIDADQNAIVPDLDVLDIKQGDILIAQQVLEAQKTLANKVELLNCFVKSNVTHQAVLDVKKNSAVLTFTIEKYPQVKFGSTQIIGLTQVKPAYVLREITWHQGECFKPTILKDFRSEMRKKPVFSDVNLLYSEQENRDDEIPLTVELTESKHRTVKIGVGYNSDEGPGFYSHWENRNYFGMGENLSIGNTVNSVLQNIKVQYLNPYFQTKDKQFVINTELKHEDADQYEASSWVSMLGIRHKIKEYWYLQYGIGYHLSKITDHHQKGSYGLIYIPLDARYDSRNDPLDASKGIFFNIGVAPYWDTFDQSTFFLKARGDARVYWSLNKSHYTILASRLAIGAITGTSKNVIPADLRFYAGGGQSVRGYKYQSLGKMVDGVAQGGRSLVEVSLELRQKITDTYGFVVFLDGGNVYDEKIPNFNQKIYWAAGLGFRYYTRFGPIRLDVAVPIDKRSGVDDSYQLYISIGQAY